jgi:chorismate mutase/prephenate dehydratase
MAQPETSDPTEVETDEDGGLERLRERIDSVDREILRGLNERARIVQRVGQLKREAGSAVYEPSRERCIVEALCRANEGPFPDAGIAPVFREIISATRSLEEPVRVAYLGPEGTFSHQATREKFGDNARLVAVQSIPEVFAAVESRKSTLGVVPVENTTEGVVTQTLDALAEFEVEVCAEVALRVSLDLLSQSERIEDVCRVASHPQPLAQCRRWLDRHLPDAERIETASTAAAAQLAAGDAAVAAIASPAAASVHGLHTLESALEDRSDNRTRFLVIGLDRPARSGNDLTSAVFTIRKDRPGGVHALIEPMARLGVNLTSIQLRPINGKPWEYLFFIDLEGHRDDPDVAQALDAASEVALSARILGSFPRAPLDRARGDR